MGWPCPPYSNAVRKEGRGSRDPVLRETDRWLNTEMVCSVVRSMFASRSQNEGFWGILLENVPGLVQAPANRFYLQQLVRSMCSVPLQWRVQLLSPSRDLGHGPDRERLVLAGVREDLVARARDQDGCE